MLKKLKKALGFDTMSEPDEEEYTPYGDSSQRKPYINPFKKEESVADDVKPDEKSDTIVAESPVSVATDSTYELPDDFLNSIIQIINANLPQIVKDSIDINAEKKALTQTFGAYFNKMIEDVRKSAIVESKSQWDAELKALNQKIATLTETANEYTQKVEEARQKQHLEETKRRAAEERVNELSTTVSTLEAELEQLTIEKKSLLNKFKVMQVHADDAEVYKEQLEERNKLIAELNKKLSEHKASSEEAAAKIDALNQEIADAKAKQDSIADIEKQLEEFNSYKEQKLAEIQSFEAQIEELRKGNENISAQLKDAEARNKELNDTINSIKAEHDVAIKQLEANHADAIKSIKAEQQNTLTELEKEIEARKAEKSEHEKEIKFLNAQFQRRETELTDEIKQLSERKPTIKLNNDGDIDDDIREAVNEVFGLDEPQSSDSATPAEKAEPVEPKTATQYMSEPFSSDNIDAIFDTDTEYTESKVDTKQATISAIDDMDTIDWLMPVPPVEAEKIVPEIDEEEVAKEIPSTDNKQQMSLF